MPRCRRTFVLLPVLAASLVACTDDADQPAADPAVPVGEDAACPDDLVEGLTAWGASGFSGVVVVADADTSCRLAIGSADRDADRPMAPASVFEIGSVTKTFVAAAILQLAADGALSLDDPVGRHVAGLTGPVADLDLESLVLHTSGLVGAHGEDHVPLSEDEAIAAASALDVDPAAAGRYLYSNAGYTLLALVIQSVSGSTYREHLVEHVLPEGAGFWDGEPAPTGRRAVGYAGGRPAPQQGDFAGPHWGLDGSGGIAMSAPQLARWTQDVFGGGTAFDAEVADAMARTALEHDGQGVTFGWASLGTDVLGEPALASAGGGGDTGHDVVVLWLPASRRAIVFAANDDRVTAEALLRAVGPALVAGEAIPRPGATVTVGADELAAAVGTYVTADGGRLDVSVDGDGLVVVPVGSEALAALLPADPGEDVAAHEEAVADLLAGRTGPGAEEVGLLEEEYGELAGVDVLGSTTDGELRTYVRIRLADATVEGWYALNDAGGIEAVDLSGPPQVRLVAAADGFVVEGRPPGDGAVTVTFDGTMATVTGPAGTLGAERR